MPATGRRRPEYVLGAGDVQAAEDPILGGANILVADDEPNIRATISDVLRKYGAKVTVASNGAEAITISEQQRFDLVLSDIKMPDRTGYDVFESVRHSAPNCPVILMTGSATTQTTRSFAPARKAFKPFSLSHLKVDTLLTEVRKALQLQQPAQ